MISLTASVMPCREARRVVRAHRDGCAAIPCEHERLVRSLLCSERVHGIFEYATAGNTGRTTMLDCRGSAGRRVRAHVGYFWTAG